MSGARFLLLFVGGGDGWAGWLRLDGGAVVERGADVSAVPPLTDDLEERIVLVVPGVDVLIHWIDLPPLAPAQAIAAARLLAAKVSAAPVDRLHVALGQGEAGLRCMAVVDVERVAGWIADAQAQGYDPDHLLPETLLLPPPHEGVRRWARDGLHILRGEHVALAAEPALAALIAPQPIVIADDEEFERGIGAAIEAMPVDLRQGAFARRRRWAIDGKLVRRLGIIAGTIFVVTLLIQAVLVLRYDLDTARLERELATVARDVLPRGERIASPTVQLRERLAELRGGGLGFGRTGALLFAAVRDTANVELSELLFERDGSLRVTVVAPASADIAALERRLGGQGLAVAGGAIQQGGGRQIVELMVTAR